MTKPVSYDVAVVGLGAMGAAALYQLAKRGVKAVGMDRFSPPHDQGSTHGETRITRQGIGEGENYTPLASRSHEIWRELEAETGESLLVECGCLVVSSGQPVQGSSIRSDFLTQTRKAAERYSIAHEVLSADEIRRRFPQFSPADHEVGYFEPGGGFVRPENCIAAQLHCASQLGAKILTNTIVLAIEQNGSGVRIATDRDDILAGQVIISAGAWAPKLLGGMFERALAPMRQVMHWFPLEKRLSQAWEGGPTYIWQHDKGPNGAFYGFPSLPGSGTVKAATEQYGVIVDPNRIERAVQDAEGEGMYATHLKGRFNGVLPRASRSMTCLYTVTPDSDFLIDRHPEHENILVVSPCSGHGFKHSAAIGEACMQLVTDGKSRFDLSGFSGSRHSIRSARPGQFAPAMQA